MNKLYYLIILFLLKSFHVKSQVPDWVWAKNSGGPNADLSTAIVADADGNSFITGNFYSDSITFGSTALINTVDSGNSVDYFIAKHDASGNMLWAKGASGSGYDYGLRIALDASGNSYVTGYFYSPFIIFGSDTLTNNSINHSDFFLIKYDSSGNVLWAKSGGGIEDDYGTGITTDANGNCFVTGAFKSPLIILGSDTLTNIPFNTNFFIVKFDSSGNIIWAKNASGWVEDMSSSIVADGIGNSYVVGNFIGPSLTFGSFTLFNAGLTNIFIVKYDSSGNEVWAISAGGTSMDNVGSIAMNSGGKLLITGSFSSPIATFDSITLINAGSFSSDFFVVQYSSLGDVVWAKSAGGIDNEGGLGIAGDLNGNSYITGGFDSYSLTFGTTTLYNTPVYWGDIFVVKYDSAGNVLWAKSAGGNEEDWGTGISVDANENSYITGSFLSPALDFGSTALTNAGSNDIFIAKLDNPTSIVEENNSLNSINIFPVPIKDILNATVSNNELSEIIIYDIISRKLLQQKFTNSISLNTAKLAKGIYIYEVRNKNGVIKKGKVVKD